LAPGGRRRGRALLTGHPHGGGSQRPTAWRRGLEAPADWPNVVIKLSKLGLSHGRWDIPSNIRVVREVAANFGADRILFASSLPVSFSGVCSSIVLFNCID